METKSSDSRVVVLIGGSGSNLQALIDDTQQHHRSYSIVGVISHRPEAYGLVRAQNASITTTVVDHKQYDIAAFESALLTAVKAYSPTLVVMAGFMRILTAEFVEQFPSQILNIHPSLLPKFKGLHTHQRALEAGETEHGVSIHYVTKELDGGPIIAQVKVPIFPNDVVDTVRDRVFTAEHWLYPQVVEWCAQKRLKCIENIVTLDGKRLGPLGLQLTLPTARTRTNFSTIDSSDDENFSEQGKE